MPPAGLEKILSGLKPAPAALESRVLAGRARNEDACVVAMPDGKALVQTVDILAPLVDDAYEFGRIAAANALSDVYAVGGTPWCAMNIACFPACLVEEQADTLQAILRGGLDTLTQAGAVLVGGHTVDDRDIKYGLAVSGLIDPQCIATNDGLREGDVLVLTKPLGSGILSTGIKARWDDWQQSEAALCHWCGRLNAGGAAVIRALGLRAATDITGFGLGGHLLEMALASHKCVRIESAGLPLFDAALPYARNGLIPASSHSNRQHWASSCVLASTVSPELESLVFDVQTSGGLVLAVPARKLDQAREMLAASGDCTAVIGEVLPPRADGKALHVV